MSYLPSDKVNVEGLKKGSSKYGQLINADDASRWAGVSPAVRSERFERWGYSAQKAEAWAVMEWSQLPSDIKKLMHDHYLENSREFRNEAPEFSAEIKRLAEKNGKSESEVRALWKKYTQDCQSYDQSPVLSEFCQWNHLKNDRGFDPHSLAKAVPCPGCQNSVSVVDTTTGLCKGCFDKDQEKSLDNAMVDWKCPKCGNEASVSSVYDEKICMKAGCGTSMERKNADSLGICGYCKGQIVDDGEYEKCRGCGLQYDKKGRKNEDSANLGFQSTEKTTTFDRNKDPLRDGTKLGNEKYGNLKMENDLKAPWTCDECNAELPTDHDVTSHKHDTGHSSYKGVQNHEGPETPMRDNGSDVAVSGEVKNEDDYCEFCGGKEGITGYKALTLCPKCLSEYKAKRAKAGLGNADGHQPNPPRSKNPRICPSCNEDQELVKQRGGTEHSPNNCPMKGKENSVTCAECSNDLTEAELADALDKKMPYCSNCMNAKENHSGAPVPWGAGAAPENDLANTPDGTFTEPERLEYDNDSAPDRSQAQYGVEAGKERYGSKENSLYTVLPQYDSKPTVKMVNDNIFRQGVEDGKKKYGAVRNEGKRMGFHFQTEEEAKSKMEEMKSRGHKILSEPRKIGTVWEFQYEGK